MNIRIANFKMFGQGVAFLVNIIIKIMSDHKIVCTMRQGLGMSLALQCFAGHVNLCMR